MFYKKLKELRKENKISQRTLADMLGITQQAVAKWETGRSTPDTDTLQKLSSIFKVSIDNLLGVEKSLDNAFTTVTQLNSKSCSDKYLQQILRFCKD